MTQRRYTEEFKEQVIQECRQINNIALVARRHEIAVSTIHGWMKN